MTAAQPSESATISLPPDDGAPAPRGLAHDTFYPPYHSRDTIALPPARHPEQGYPRSMARHLTRRRSKIRHGQ